MCYTEFIFDADRRFELGWTLIGVIAVNVVFNFLVMLYLVIRRAIFKVKHWIVLRRHKKKMAQMNDHRDNFTIDDF